MPATASDLQNRVRSDPRSFFPVTRDWAYWNHAAVAPLSLPARDAVAAWAEEVAASGIVHEGRFWERVEQIRAAAAAMVNATSDEIAFAANTSQGLAWVAEGFPWRKGDNVVVAEGEYPANVYPWLHLAERGVAVKRVPVVDHRIALGDLDAAIDGHTRLLSLSAVQFSTGFRSDLARVGELCRSRGIDFCVDAIQALGVLPLDVREMHIDYLAADGHKWLLAPEGAAVFFIAAGKLDRIRPTSVGWKSVAGMFDFDTIDLRLKDSARRFEGGTYNMPGLLGLGASIDLLAAAGVDWVAGRVKELTDECVARLAAAGAEVVSPRGDGEWSGIVSFRWPGGDSEAVAAHCRGRRVELASRGGRLRVSPHFYNDADDLDRLMAALDSA